jgi:hypothetical protein
MPCTNGHNNFDDVPTCRICGVNTFVAPTVVLQAPPENNGMAIASMVLGIVWVYGIGSILALVFGYQAKREIARSGQRGSGVATAGIVLGWVGIAGLILAISLWFTFIHSVPFPTCPSNCVHVNGS